MSTSMYSGVFNPHRVYGCRCLKMDRRTETPFCESRMRFRHEQSA